MADAVITPEMPASGNKSGRLRARRGLLAIITMSIAWALLIALAFFALNALSLKTDNDAEIAKVGDAFDNRVVRSDGAWLGGNIDIGAHQWNDCLILNQAIDRRATTAQLAVSPLYTGPLLPTLDPCPYAAAFARGRPVPVQPAFYHRYLHGHTVLARLLLVEMSVAGIRLLYSGLLTLLLMLGIVLTTFALAKGERLQQSCFWLITLFSFMRFFGLESVGQSLAHGPSDLVLIGFVLFLAGCSATGGLDPRKVPMAAAIFGALTIIFEFLTGGVPLGLALLIGGLPFALRPLRRSDGETLGRIIVEAVLAFAVSILMIITIKAILIAAVFGPNEFGPIVRQLSYRIGLAAPEVGGEQYNGVAALIANMIANLGVLATGQTIMAAAILMTSICAGGWATGRLMNLANAAIRVRAIALASSNLVIVGWILLFMQHTAQHARFMDRILVWIVASGFSLFALAVINGCTVRQSEHGLQARRAEMADDG